MKFYISLYPLDGGEVDVNNDFESKRLEPGIVFVVDFVSSYGVQLKSVCGKYASNGFIAIDLLRFAFKEQDFIEKIASR